MAERVRRIVGHASAWLLLNSYTKFQILENSFDSTCFTRHFATFCDFALCRRQAVTFGSYRPLCQTMCIHATTCETDDSKSLRTVMLRIRVVLFLGMLVAVALLSGRPVW